MAKNQKDVKNGKIMSGKIMGRIANLRFEISELKICGTAWSARFAFCTSPGLRNPIPLVSAVPSGLVMLVGAPTQG
jgi:hypothetical protein